MKMGNIKIYNGQVSSKMTIDAICNKDGTIVYSGGATIYYEKSFSISLPSGEYTAEVTFTPDNCIGKTSKEKKHFQMKEDDMDVTFTMSPPEGEVIPPPGKAV
jgi:hypothetical protein